MGFIIAALVAIYSITAAFDAFSAPAGSRCVLFKPGDREGSEMSCSTAGLIELGIGGFVAIGAYVELRNRLSRSRSDSQASTFVSKDEARPEATLGAIKSGELGLRMAAFARGRDGEDLDPQSLSALPITKDVVQLALTYSGQWMETDFRKEFASATGRGEWPESSQERFAAAEEEAAQELVELALGGTASKDAVLVWAILDMVLAYLMGRAEDLEGSSEEDELRASMAHFLALKARNEWSDSEDLDPETGESLL